MSYTLKATILSTIKAMDTINANNQDLMNYALCMTLVDYRNEIAVILGEYYAVTPKASQKTGWLTFDKDTAAEQMLKKFHKLHPDSTAAKSSPKKEAVTAPSKTYDAVEKIILQSGMNRAEFNALLAQLKASVDFA
jgi:hypothetical protein